jgi:hypothetical protein
MSGTESVTPREVAQWMFGEIERDGAMHQAYAADEIQRRFGPGFVKETEHGHLSVDPQVLREFRKLHQGRVAYRGLMRVWYMKPAE